MLFRSPYELLLDKAPTGVVELPIDWLNDDNAYFGGVANGSNPDPDVVERIFESEFDQAYEEGFEDMLRRVPDIQKIRDLIGYSPTFHLDQILESVIEYQRSRMADRNSLQEIFPT